MLASKIATKVGRSESGGIGGHGKLISTGPTVSFHGICGSQSIESHEIEPQSADIGVTFSHRKWTLISVAGNHGGNLSVSAIFGYNGITFVLNEYATNAETLRATSGFDSAGVVTFLLC